MSKIYKSSQVTIDSKGYVLTDKIKVLEKKKVAETQEEQEASIDEFIKAKEEILESAKKESDEIISQATEEREEIISDAYDESISIKEKARNEGYAAGKEEALEEYRQKKKHEIDSLLVYKKEIMEKYDDYFNNRKEEMIDLVLDSVEKILNKHIKEDEELIKDLIIKGIKKSTLRTSVGIKVSNDDYEKAVHYKELLLASLPRIDQIDFSISESLGPGECIIESDNNGMIDISVSTQFENLKAIYRRIIER